MVWVHTPYRPGSERVQIYKYLLCTNSIQSYILYLVGIYLKFCKFCHVEYIYTNNDFCVFVRENGDLMNICVTIACSKKSVAIFFYSIGHVLSENIWLGVGGLLHIFKAVSALQ